MIAYDRGVETKQNVLHSWVKPNKKSGKVFESLIIFFTHDWWLSLKQLYSTEWIVFTVRIDSTSIFFSRKYLFDFNPCLFIFFHRHWGFH